MNEIIFLVEENEEGGYKAKGLGISLITEADSMEELRVALKEAVHYHYNDQDKRPELIRLHVVKDVVISA